MSALDDIRLELKRLPPCGPGKKRYVLLGESALRAVQCATPDCIEPAWIDGAAVLQTGEFKGWEIEDRVVAERLFGGKRR